MSVQQVDPLEDVLALVGIRSRLSVRLEAGGDWALAFEPPPAVKFNALRSGTCLLTVDGVPGPIPLAEGDCFLLVQPRPWTLTSRAGLTPVPAHDVFERSTDGVARAGTGSGTVLIGGRFDFGDRARALLLDALPPVLHVPGSTPAAAALRWSLAQIEQEQRTRPLAAGLVTGHLAQIMLIHMLRLHLTTGSPTAPGLLAGLADPVVAPALHAIHTAPSHPWTVATLAGTAAVSRSTMAARFTGAVGRSPLDYLTHWRLELAADHLRHTTATIATIARTVGYGSESALSTAFKRATGTSPRAYRTTTPS